MSRTEGVRKVSDGMVKSNTNYLCGLVTFTSTNGTHLTPQGVVVCRPRVVGTDRRSTRRTSPMKTGEVDNRSTVSVDLWGGRATPPTDRIKSTRLQDGPGRVVSQVSTCHRGKVSLSDGVTFLGSPQARLRRRGRTPPGIELLIRVGLTLT